MKEEKKRRLLGMDGGKWNLKFRRKKRQRGWNYKPLPTSAVVNPPPQSGVGELPEARDGSLTPARGVGVLGPHPLHLCVGVG